MHLAAELAKIDVVEMLLKAGLDLTIQDKVGIFNSVALPRVRKFQYLRHKPICFLVGVDVAGQDTTGCGSQGK